MIRTALFSALALALGACSPPAQTSAIPSTAPMAGDAKKPAPPTDAWIGKWIGVEGNFLDIQAGLAPGVYAITEQTLDGPKTYVGTGKDMTIKIVDAGKTFAIHAGSGDDTGLKYLAGKTDCLIIESGRGFCR
ncbi:MAG: hypothetical protein WDN76_13060 [Alphaproteobacteria bacterium]